MSAVTDIVADGLSIPFFSFGRRIHSRIVWTSLTTAVPKRLRGMWCTPVAMTSATPSIYGSATRDDIEIGIPLITMAGTTPGVHHIIAASDTGVPVESQEELAANGSRLPVPGEAEMLRTPAIRADSTRGLRRRFHSPDTTRRPLAMPNKLVRVMVASYRL